MGAPSVLILLLLVVPLVVVGAGLVLLLGGVQRLGTLIGSRRARCSLRSQVVRNLRLSFSLLTSAAQDGQNNNHEEDGEEGPEDRGAVSLPASLVRVATDLAVVAVAIRASRVSDRRAVTHIY